MFGLFICLEGIYFNVGRYLVRCLSPADEKHSFMAFFYIAYRLTGNRTLGLKWNVYFQHCKPFCLWASCKWISSQAGYYFSGLWWWFVLIAAHQSLIGLEWWWWRCVCVPGPEDTDRLCVCVYRQTGRAAEEDHCRLVADSLAVSVCGVRVISAELGLISSQTASAAAAGFQFTTRLPAAHSFSHC